MYFLGCANYMQLEKAILRDYSIYRACARTELLNFRALHMGMYVGISLL